jgi:sec-independent protein translocase protein TatA
MAIMPLEYIVIAAIAVAFLVFGPKKIPELAKSIGQARREFAGASSPPTEPVVTQTTRTAVGQSITEDPLIRVAKTLGVTTEGKTADEISNEIVAKRTNTVNA